MLEGWVWRAWLRPGCIFSKALIRVQTAQMDGESPLHPARANRWLIAEFGKRAGSCPVELECAPLQSLTES